MPSPGGGPSPEVGPIPPNIETSPDQKPDGQIEFAPAPAAPEVERAGNEGANQNQGMVIQTPLPQPAAVPATPVDDDDQPVQIDSPALASDVDVIEKEWVDKAKEIVNESRDDPHRQNHNVSILKADYMKKRYGKDIKIPDDNTAKV